jgi:hypothetical protein
MYRCMERPSTFETRRIGCGIRRPASRMHRFERVEGYGLLSRPVVFASSASVSSGDSGAAEAMNQLAQADRRWRPRQAQAPRRSRRGGEAEREGKGAHSSLGGAPSAFSSVGWSETIGLRRSLCNQEVGQAEIQRWLLTHDLSFAFTRGSARQSKASNASARSRRVVGPAPAGDAVQPLSRRPRLPYQRGGPQRR